MLLCLRSSARTKAPVFANAANVRLRQTHRACSHEQDYDANTKDDPPYLNYRTRFSMPSPSGGDAQHRPMYWSADVGSAHVVGINSDAYFFAAAAQKTVVAEQFAWLERDLQVTKARETTTAHTHIAPPPSPPTSRVSCSRGSQCSSGCGAIVPALYPGTAAASCRSRVCAVSFRTRITPCYPARVQGPHFVPGLPYI